MPASLGYASAAVMGDFVVVDMFAEACTGQASRRRKRRPTPQSAPSATTGLTGARRARRRRPGEAAAGDRSPSGHCRHGRSTRRARDACGEISAPQSGAPALAFACSTIATFSALVFMAPAAALLLVFLTYPLGLGFWLGFTDAKIGRAGHFIGFENFVSLAHDSVFWLVGVQHDLLHGRRQRHQVRARASGWRCCSTSSCRSSRSSAPSCCCRSSCRRCSRRSPSGGSTTRSSRSSPGRSSRWASSTSTSTSSASPWNARLSMIAANVWRGVPFVAITLLAGLQTISPSLYEAASARRRDAVAALPLRHAAAADADHRRRDDVLGAVHVHRLPADLRAHARRSAQRHPSDGDAVVPARHLRRQPRRGRGDRRPRWCRSCWRRSCSAISGCSAGAGSRAARTDR